MTDKLEQWNARAEGALAELRGAIGAKAGWLRREAASGGARRGAERAVRREAEALGRVLAVLTDALEGIGVLMGQRDAALHRVEMMRAARRKLEMLCRAHGVDTSDIHYIHTTKDRHLA